MVAVGWRSDGRELQVAGGGARWQAAAPRRNIAGDDLNGCSMRQISQDKDQKKEGDTRNSLRGLDRRKTRRRRRSMARAELRFGFLGDGGVEEEKSSSERCEVRRCSGAAFIGGEGRGGAGKAVGGGHAGGRH
jgi:hypothetical protein